MDLKKFNKTMIVSYVVDYLNSHCQNKGHTESWSMEDLDPDCNIKKCKSYCHFSECGIYKLCDDCQETLDAYCSGEFDNTISTLIDSNKELLKRIEDIEALVSTLVASNKEMLEHIEQFEKTLSTLITKNKNEVTADSIGD